MAAHGGRDAPAPSGQAVANAVVRIAADSPVLHPLLHFTSSPPAHQVAQNDNSPIAPGDAALYRRIFALQDAGQWDQANEAMNRLTDRRLRGPVLMQRYLQDATYHATFTELAGWLDLYADLPGADRIYRLAQLRKPADFTGTLRAPMHTDGIVGYLDIFTDGSDAYVSPRLRSRAQEVAVDLLGRKIRDAVNHGAATRAGNLLTQDPAAKLLDPIEYDQLRAQAASAYYYAGRLVTAQNLALASARRSGDQAPLAGWIGGLTSWRHGDYKRAAGLFELSATSPYASSWTAAAGAYWAYRAYARAGDPAAAAPWLQRAATYPRTFYGLIALRALRRDIDFHWDMPALTPALEVRLAALPAGRRAIALVAADQRHLAEQELLQVNPGTDRQLTMALLAYANHAGLPALAMRLAEAVPHPGGGLYDAALYPLSPWQPTNGYLVDRALIHAIVRQESRFDPNAQSQSGAAGLMQLMPDTVSDVTGGKDAPSLRDPQVNLDLGQRYVSTLLDQEPVSAELISLAVAYNAGPGNLRHWKETMADAQGKTADPLLFIESIPVAQTRAFAERVMANYWIYELRLKQPVPTLDSVAGGHWAQYVAVDEAQHASLEDADLRRITVH